MAKVKPKVDKNKTTIDGVDNDGKKMSVVVIRPNSSKIKDAQLVYNRAFRDALESGALLRQKLDSYMTEQGIWGEEKEKTYQELMDKINTSEKTIATGGIKLTEARQIALDMRRDRAEFRDLLAERTTLDGNTVEGQSDNARFNYLVSVSVVDVEKGNAVFKSVEDYEDKASEPYISEAASELARMMYDLDPNYDAGLPENKFLKDYDYVNEDLRLINKEGHLVDTEGRLVNEDGRYIDKDGTLVDKEGVQLDEEYNYKLDQKPFLSDSGEEVPIPKEEEEKLKAKKKGPAKVKVESDSASES